MAKNIDWLDQFAVDQYKQLKKTASINKIAEQIIVNCSTYPNAKVGSLVDYENNKYKVIDTEYHDKSGPGILLEKVADLESPTTSGEVSTKDGTVPASTENNSANCGDIAGLPKTAAKEDEDILADFDDSNSIEEETPLVADNNEYPSVIPSPGGDKPAPSAPIEGPGKKNVTDAPYHPTFDPGEQYALDSLDEWQDAADRTLETIKQEDAIDRTTVEGHYTWNTEIDNMLDDVPAGTPEDYDSLSEFDDSGSTDNTNDESNDDVVDEAVDTIVNNDNVDEDIPEDISDSIDENTDINEDIPTDDEEKSEDTIDNADIDEDIPTDDEAIEDTTLEDIDIEDIDEELPTDEDEEEKKTVASVSSTRRISRLAYKNQ